MAILEIKKLGNKNFWHYYNDNDYSASDVKIAYAGDYVKLTRSNGAIILKQDGFLFSDVGVYDVGGSEETFANIEDLEQRLIDLGYVAYGVSVDEIDGINTELDKIGTSSINSTNNKICLQGIDSLTDGAGGFNYRSSFDVKYRGAFQEDSELGFAHLDFATSVDLGISFGKSSGLDYMTNEPDFTVSPVKYSLSGKGLFGTSMVEDSFTYGANKHFDNITFYYLQQPGGGTFKYGFSNISPTEYPTVDTDGALSIQKIDVTRKKSDNTTFKVSSINGDCAFYAVWFKIGDSSVSTCNISKGGMLLEKIMDLDSASRQYWYGELQPSCVLFNAGTNDRLTVSPTNFKTYLGNYIDEVLSGSPETKFVIVEPNQSSDYNSTFAVDYTSKRYELSSEKDVDILDLTKKIGDYDYFNSNGLMLDGVHPNEDGFELISKETLQFLSVGNYGNYSIVDDDLFTGSLSVDKLAQDINIYSLADPLVAVEYTAYTLGFINGFIDFYFDLITYARLSGSGNMKVKRVQFKVNNGTVIGNATSVGQIITNDDYRDPPSGVVPDITFTLAIESNKAVLKYTSDNNLSSLSITGTIKASKIVNTAADLVYYY